MFPFFMSPRTGRLTAADVREATREAKISRKSAREARGRAHEARHEVQESRHGARKGVEDIDIATADEEERAVRQGLSTEFGEHGEATLDLENLAQHNPDEIREVERATGFIYCGTIEGEDADVPAAVLAARARGAALARATAAPVRAAPIAASPIVDRAVDGDYQYVKLADGTIVITEGPTGKGTRHRPGSKFYAALDATFADPEEERASVRDYASVALHPRKHARELARERADETGRVYIGRIW